VKEMTTEVSARLQWCINFPFGTSFPRGERFATPARFDHQGDDWTDDAWSLVVSAKMPVQDGFEQAVKVRFLMDEAPQSWLVPGKKFELYEGELLLAKGVIEG
jgi:hypothetical protein